MLVDYGNGSTRLRLHEVQQTAVQVVRDYSILFMLACSAFLMSVSLHAAPLDVGLILSSDATPYRVFADTFKNKIVTSDAEVRIQESRSIDDIKADIIIAVGMAAAVQSVGQTDVPVLVAMIPEQSYRELIEQRSLSVASRKVSAVYLDQPVTRRLDFMRAVLPGHRRIGLLYSQTDNFDLERLRRDVEAHGGTLVERRYEEAERLFPILNAVLNESDVLFGIPDREIYSGGNIRNIMLASYQHNVPMVGISKAYVHAGALCAVFATPEQLAVQTGEAVISISRGGEFPAPQYSSDYSFELNLPVARSLGISLPTPEMIRARMSGSGKAVR